MEFIDIYAEAAKTALGFFWKAGWAFVLGYFISSIIQSFVPKGKLTQYMGDSSTKSVSLATAFGAMSSSCSFAALAAARALIQKGAHFIAAIAFMFASTNLVIELGILIYIFLGWQFLAAEILGGILLIVISRFLMKRFFPEGILDEARKKAEEFSQEEDEFDWKERVRSWFGWRLVGKKFVGEWAMVWEEITIGFTVAGFVAVLIPAGFWKALFLADIAAEQPLDFFIVLQNAMLAPFVAAATFIGSMGNIPLATVLNSSGVLFAGIMGFIYSDLMVPPLVRINARYYGWKVALYIAVVMYASIVLTALALHYSFALFSITPESARAIRDVAQFKFDYTFWMNLASAGLVVVLAWLSHSFGKHHSAESMDMPGGGMVKRVLALICLVVVFMGAAAHLLLTVL